MKRTVQPPAPRVLLIDDSPDDRALVVRELSRSFPEAEVTEAWSPETFERALAEGPYDVVVTDYQLNWTTGLELHERLRAAWGECRAIMYTGAGTEAVAVEAMKRGVDDYIVKSPRHLAQLASAVRAAYARQSDRRALQALERDRQEKVEALQTLSDELARSNARLRETAEIAEAARLASDAASRAKSDFLATMSHELRTPLNAIVGYLELLEIGVSGPLTDAQRGSLERIRRSSEHLLALIEDVLDISKIESSRLAVHPQLAAAEDVVESAVAMVRPRAEAQSIELTVGPEADRRAPFYADVDRVRQILVNLLGNAVKFTGEGGRVSVEYGVEPFDARPPRPARSWFRVSDTGIGMAPEELERIFDPFVQLESGHTRVHGGVGLGLAISRRLARIMRGDIEVRSQPGAGSVFTLWLPSEPSIQEPAVEGALAPEPGAAHTTGLAALGRALYGKLGQVVEEVTHRLAADEQIPTGGLRFSEVTDHQATLVADILTTLVALDEFSGAPSRVLSDGAEVQRTVIQLHAQQRAELGWPQHALRREFAILREVLRSAVREMSDADPEVREHAVTILDRILEQAAYLSVQAYRVAKREK